MFCCSCYIALVDTCLKEDVDRLAPLSPQREQKRAALASMRSSSLRKSVDGIFIESVQVGDYRNAIRGAAGVGQFMALVFRYASKERQDYKTARQNEENER